MTKSQNGYSACDSSVIAKYTVPGTSVKLNLRKGDVSVVLLDFAAWFHKNIEPLVQAQCGGYNCRVIAGSSTTSNHGSGTAEDLNWTKHPQGKRNAGLSAAQVSKINAKVKTYGGVIRWGNTYSGTPDTMHYEINAGPAAVKVQADKIREAAKPKPPPVSKPTPPKSTGLKSYANGSRENSETKNNVGTDVATLQRFIGPSKAGAADGHFGSKTKAGVRWYQGDRGLKVDGIAGAHTWAPILKAIK